MTGGFQVDPTALTKASSDIVDYLKTADRIDLETSSGDRGSYGHDDVYDAVARFCTTWQLATVVLVRRSNTAAAALLGMAKNYLGADESGGQTMKQVEGRIPTD